MHRSDRLTALLLCLVLGGCTTSELDQASANPDLLVGTWLVDLRPTPDSDPYFREFVVTAVDGNSFTGIFYGTPVSEARINTDWGKLRIAFVTADGSGPYHHSAVLDGGTLEGLSNSTGRGFLSFWSAEKQ